MYNQFDIISGYDDEAVKKELTPFRNTHYDMSKLAAQTKV
jgi:hypothetical protein